MTKILMVGSPFISEHNYEIFTVAMTRFNSFLIPILKNLVIKLLFICTWEIHFQVIKWKMQVIVSTTCRTNSLAPKSWSFLGKTTKIRYRVSLPIISWREEYIWFNKIKYTPGVIWKPVKPYSSVWNYTYP